MTSAAVFPATSPARLVVISVLGVTQILAWGSSYYLPAVLAAPIARETGWPLSWIVGGLSLGLLVAAMVSPLTGATIERNGGRYVLVFSAVTLGAGQIGLAFAPNLPAYVAAWLVIGVGMGTGLYDAAFSTLGRLYGRDARSAITTLTLFGGFASTVCWPLSAFLVSRIGWRDACLVYAAIQIFVSLPLYLTLVPHGASEPPTRPQDAAPGAVASPREPPALLLVLLAATLTLAASLSSLMSVHLLTLLQASGVAMAAAVTLGALVGPSQVAARTIEMVIARYHHPIWTKAASVTFVATGIACLWTALPITAIALGFYGAGIGLESIARGTLPFALFGPVGYARLMGRLAVPSLFAQAAAPWLGALLLERIGASGTLGIVTCVAAFNVALTALLISAAKPGRKAAGREQADQGRQN